MSRSWSKKCYEDALRKRDFEEEFDKSRGRYGAFVKTTPEREKILCKKWASKHRVGMRSAPAKWVRETIEVPFRQACRRMLHKIGRGKVDEEDATFPVNHRTAWWKWF